MSYLDTITLFVHYTRARAGSSSTSTITPCGIYCSLCWFLLWFSSWGYDYRQWNKINIEFTVKGDEHGLRDFEAGRSGIASEKDK